MSPANTIFDANMLKAQKYEKLPTSLIDASHCRISL